MPSSSFNHAAGDLFGQRGGRSAGVNAGVLVPGGGQPIGGERGGNGAAHYPGVEASAGVAHDAAGGIGDQIGDHLLRRRAVVGQGTRHAGAQGLQAARVGATGAAVEILEMRQRMPQGGFERTAEDRG